MFNSLNMENGATVKLEAVNPARDASLLSLTPPAVELRSAETELSETKANLGTILLPRELYALVSFYESNELKKAPSIPDHLSQADLLSRFTIGELNKFRITIVDGSVNSLELNSKSLKALPELSIFIDLQELRIFDATLKDLSKLKDNTALRILNLSRCTVGDYSELAELTNLSALKLASNPRLLNSDLAIISKLKNLKELSLHGSSNISNIAALGELPELQYLDLGRTAVIDGNYSLRDFMAKNPHCEVIDGKKRVVQKFSLKSN